MRKMTRNDNISRIAIKLLGIENLDYVSYPVTFGVPFADGVLENGIPVGIIDRSGKALPVQTQPLTFWNKGLKFVKWLLVDAQIDAHNGKNELLLEYSAIEDSPKPGEQLSIEEKDGMIAVDTGPMLLYLKKSFPPWRQPLPGHDRQPKDWRRPTAAASFTGISNRPISCSMSTAG